LRRRLARIGHLALEQQGVAEIPLMRLGPRAGAVCQAASIAASFIFWLSVSA
jgi:hypothetical protein